MSTQEEQIEDIGFLFDDFMTIFMSLYSKQLQHSLKQELKKKHITTWEQLVSADKKTIDNLQVKNHFKRDIKAYRDATMSGNYEQAVKFIKKQQKDKAAQENKMTSYLRKQRKHTTEMSEAKAQLEKLSSFLIDNGLTPDQVEEVIEVLQVETVEDFMRYKKYLKEGDESDFQDVSKEILQKVKGFIFSNHIDSKRNKYLL